MPTCLLVLLSACFYVSPADWSATLDRDGDGYQGSAGTGEDCDDGDGAVHPGATESCNGVDDNCDGSTDGADAEDGVTWYEDVDEDGFGNPLESARSCVRPVGFVEAALGDEDCNDTDPDVHPGADEVCNGYDDDCDGATDEPDAVDAST